MAQGPRAVVIKRGARGCLIRTADEERDLPARQVEVVDTTGAGDAFTAAFTVALAEGKSFFQAAEMGNAGRSDRRHTIRYYAGYADPRRGRHDPANRVTALTSRRFRLRICRVWTRETA